MVRILLNFKISMFINTCTSYAFQQSSFLTRAMYFNTLRFYFRIVRYNYINIKLYTKIRFLVLCWFFTSVEGQTYVFLTTKVVLNSVRFKYRALQYSLMDIFIGSHNYVKTKIVVFQRELKLILYIQYQRHPYILQHMDKHSHKLSALIITAQHSYDTMLKLQVDHLPKYK